MGSVWAIVVAGGRGDRFGAPKQFSVLVGRRVIDRAVSTAIRTCDEVVVVLPEGVVWDGDAVRAIVTGGATRAASVRAGLAAVEDGAEVIVVHDAARPLASPQLFTAVVEAVRAGADGAVPAMPVTDTLKRVDGGQVIETVSRADVVAAQTPQAFRAPTLRAAHAGGAEGTDDAALVEAMGGRVVVVPGEATNIKITSLVDLEIAGVVIASMVPS